jgi:P pilus assembly chaperone PapD
VIRLALGFTVFLLTIAPVPTWAQGVLVAPHAVVVDPRTRTGWVQLHNTGVEPTEVTIETFFGYPVTDSAGGLMLRTIDQPDSAFPSAAAWIRAFPRRMTIPAQGRQTVRLMVTPPPGTPDGEYWARIAITSTSAAAPAAPQDSTAISVGLNLQIRTVIALLYRRGAVTTALRLSGPRAAVEGDSLVLRMKLERLGQAAWIGNVRGVLRNGTGAEVRRFEAALGTYYALEPRFTMPIAGLPPGQYSLHLEAATDRTDLPPEQLLAAPTVRDSVRVILR